MIDFGKNPVIAAVRTPENLRRAVCAEPDVIFILNANINRLEEDVKTAKEYGKKLFIHADMTEGIAKDSFGIAFIAKAGADGIISTRGNLIKSARDAGLMTVQRFFLIDCQSINTTIESVRINKPDMIEIMPGIIPKVVQRVAKEVKQPVITGGMIETKQEAIAALRAGAAAVSTSNQSIWSD